MWSPGSVTAFKAVNHPNILLLHKLILKWIIQEDTYYKFAKFFVKSYILPCLSKNKKKMIKMYNFYIRIYILSALELK